MYVCMYIYIYIYTQAQAVVDEDKEAEDVVDAKNSLKDALFAKKDML